MAIMAVRPSQRGDGNLRPEVMWGHSSMQSCFETTLVRSFAEELDYYFQSQVNLPLCCGEFQNIQVVYF